MKLPKESKYLWYIWVTDISNPAIDFYVVSSLVINRNVKKEVALNGGVVYNTQSQTFVFGQDTPLCKLLMGNDELMQLILGLIEQNRQHLIKSGYTIFKDDKP